MASHWSRMGRVTNLVYNVSHIVTVDVEDGEQFFAFASPDLDSLSQDDNLEGPLRNLTEDVEGFPMHYPATTTEGMPSLVQDFHDLLDSFNCTNSGPNCGLTRGRDSVVQLDENWSIVQRLALEYEPGGMRRAIRFKILIVAWRGFRIFIQLFIF
ncbi:PREDICTED: uncharacterized protein LOC109482945 [Branchiostoma belcheri]|uniref:Uncharacterized protein LOC109482945 n=1 Tax=Branchiostoma belcheri TaxID=7741 RepID=A0A6P4ZWX0_BRABE|nr:PREDICTED: uncharacterized protein LOC109482945 [Branchiostoma belcheri]